MSEDEKEKLAPQSRSPAYPYISLDLALERAKRIYSEIRDHAQPREVVAKAYGKPATSSATIQTFATLLQYGLLENVAGPAGRKMRISPLAQGILNSHAPQSKVREGLRTAALNPPIFVELWSHFGDTAGLNESVPLYYLTSERGHEHGGVFTDKAAHEVLRVYRATLAFVGISGDSNSQRLVESEETGIQIDPVGVQNTSEGQKPSENEIPVAHSTDRDIESQKGWSEESLIDDGGDEIKIRYRGKATLARYEFIRDYLDFKIQRLSRRP